MCLIFCEWVLLFAFLIDIAIILSTNLTRMQTRYSENESGKKVQYNVPISFECKMEFSSMGQPPKLFQISTLFIPILQNYYITSSIECNRKSHFFVVVANIQKSNIWSKTSFCIVSSSYTYTFQVQTYLHKKVQKY